ncbi:Inositol monophosphatase 1 [Dissostichus eleginoides]|uniref:inositol-phosphate phosphatase n=1 Tax=Dissostichus eleginoides TaxID=100907 RepID=A0AAD9B3C1_DISEL|nr:Inositol monophosphatase 1 [Dissostichus eleginoides]
MHRAPDRPPPSPGAPRPAACFPSPASSWSGAPYGAPPRPQYSPFSPGYTDSPGSYRGNRDSPGSYRGNRDSPGSYRGNRDSPGSYRGNRDSPGSYRGNRDSPGSYRGFGSRSRGGGFRLPQGFSPAQNHQTVLAAFLLQKEVQLKSSPADLVTETDQRVEKILISAIRARFPLHSCVEDKLFHAQRGRGAFLNGEKLQASGQEDVSKCVVVTEIGAERDDLALSTMTSNILRLLQLPVHGVRALGTAAVDMCQVATGGADAYYHIGMHCWDIAASAIIVQEAGGVVMDTDGSDFDMMSRRVIAASSTSVANSIAQVVQAFPCRRDDEDPTRCVCGAAGVKGE